MKMPRFVGFVLSLLLVATNASADEPKNESSTAPEGIVLAAVGGVGTGIGLGLMAAGALSNVSFVPNVSGCEETHGANEQYACEKRVAEREARDDAAASIKVRNGAIVAGIGAVVLALGVMIIVSSQRPEVRKPRRAGIEVQVLPANATESARPRGVAFEMPLVGGTF